MTEPTTRGAVETPLGNLARSAHTAMVRHERKRDYHEDCRADAEQRLNILWRKTCDRFGREVPADAFLLDVLDLIDIEEGDVWRWRGQRNNKGLATIRSRANDSRGAEQSLVRYLAIEFGVIEKDEWGMLYPTGDVDDVNPWHRDLRRSHVPIGNMARYAFAPKNGERSNEIDVSDRGRC